VRCSYCANKLLQKSGSTTKLRITGAVEVDSLSGKATAHCFWCKAQVEIPIELKKAAEDEERFTIPARPRTA
jgi:hypothetical protein